MKIIDKLGYYTISFLILIFKFLDLKSTNNKTKLSLFLHKRNIEYLIYENRVFINLNNNGQYFIDNILSLDLFSKYEVDIQGVRKGMVKSYLDKKHKPKNEYILQVYYNEDFEFEFVNSDYWDHLKFTIQIMNEFNLVLIFDTLFLYNVNNLNSVSPPSCQD